MYLFETEIIHLLVYTQSAHTAGAEPALNPGLPQGQQGPKYLSSQVPYYHEVEAWIQRPTENPDILTRERGILNGNLNCLAKHQSLPSHFNIF